MPIFLNQKTNIFKTKTRVKLAKSELKLKLKRNSQLKQQWKIRANRATIV